MALCGRRLAGANGHQGSLPREETAQIFCFIASPEAFRAKIYLIFGRVMAKLPFLIARHGVTLMNFLHGSLNSSPSG